MVKRRIDTAAQYGSNNLTEIEEIILRIMKKVQKGDPE